MNYHLNRQGQDLGVFTLAELRRRRALGELNGTEQVLPEGGAEWEALDVVLAPFAEARSTPPPVPVSARKKRASRRVVWVLAILAVVFLAGTSLVGILVYRFGQRLALVGGSAGPYRSVSVASRPVKVDAHALTEKEVQKQRKAFRVRQYSDGFKRDGPPAEAWSNDARQLIESWLAQNYGGDEQTNLPSPQELSDKLVAAGCKDPMVLTIAAYCSDDWNEATRRLKGAVQGFHGSSYKAYPKIYATVSLAARLSNKPQRIKELDASAMKLFDDAFNDGSLLADDEAQLADILIIGWGKSFFERNHAGVIGRVQQGGKPFEWLALTLEGEAHIYEAWRARGKGYANTVTARSWQGFSDHLAKARTSLAKAWKLRPDLPLPAAEMITVAMGQSDVEDMRRWFDRAVSAQFDHPTAWSHFRWGLRPRWLGSEEAVLALGIMGLNTGRFDTDVPHTYWYAIYDVESDRDLPVGEHIYGREDIWPHVQKMFEGYIAGASGKSQAESWRGDYAVVAYLAGNYDVARRQLEAINWELWPVCTKHWGRDLSAMNLEVAARTGSLGKQIAQAESARKDGKVARALQLYSKLCGATNADERTGKFVRIQTASLEFEKRLQKGEWMDFLPADKDDDNWTVSLGKILRVVPAGLEIESGRDGHLLYSRANVGRDFEARGEFEVVGSATNGFQAGLVMGMPDFDARLKSSDWFAFRMMRGAREKGTAVFSKGWTRNQLSKPVKLNADRNKFEFRFENGKATASVNGEQLFHDAALKNNKFRGDSFLVGLCAFKDSKETTIRYHNLQIRRISLSSAPKGK